MSKEYYYLISSLPALTIDESNNKAKISIADFDDQCRANISEEEAELIEQISLTPTVAMLEGDGDKFLTNKNNPTSIDTTVVEDFYKWEMHLRNAIARKRAPRNRDLTHILQYDYDFHAEIERTVQNAYSMTNPLDRENLFDNLRWNFLNELENCHQFDFGFLCVYKIKLMIVAKRLSRDIEVAYECLENVVENLQQKSNTIAEKS